MRQVLLGCGVTGEQRRGGRARWSREKEGSCWCDIGRDFIPLSVVVAVSTISLRSSNPGAIFHAGPVGDGLVYFFVHGDVESNEVEEEVAEQESDGEEVGEVRAVRKMSWCVSPVDVKLCVRNGGEG